MVQAKAVVAVVAVLYDAPGCLKEAPVIRLSGTIPADMQYGTVHPRSYAS